MRKFRRAAQRRQREKQLPISAELAQDLKDQMARFKEKFGRDPKPDEPLFFDPDADTPTFVSAEKAERKWNELCDLMDEQGVDPAIVYAARKTGRIVTEQNAHLLDEDEQCEWSKAGAEGRRLTKTT